MNLVDKLILHVEEHKDELKEILFQQNSLRPEQYAEILTLQEETSRPFAEILLKKNYLTSQDLMKLVCSQFQLTYLKEIEIDEIDPLITKNIPINYAKQNELLPLLETPFSVTVAVSNPFLFHIKNDLQLIFNKEIHLVVAPALKIHEAINKIYEKANQNMVDSIEDEFEENIDLDIPIDILDAQADEAPVIRFVNSVIFRAVKEGASDIHIEPYERETIYRFRINGVMQEILRQPKKTHAAVTSRIKVMAKLDIAEKRLPQDGRIKIKIAGKDVDIRLSTVPIQHGERVVMRVLEKDNMVLKLETLGFEGNVLQSLDDLVRRKHGVFYVSGPTGHGKTTTLFAMLDRINTPDRMIITVEDPVEYEMAGISQIQINSKIDLSFARALRSILRQNPDVIMIGETRDKETADISLTASQTGHFVLSTIHTNDAPSTPTRLIDMGVKPFLIASSLVAVLAQRLIRTLCTHCREQTTLSDLDIELLKITKIPKNREIYRPRGCPQCKNGYAGRTTIGELLLINDEVRSLILEQSDASQIKKAAMRAGMTTLRQNALHKLYRGITSTEEIIRAVNDEDSGDDDLE